MKPTKAHAYTTPGSIAPLVTPDECARLFQLPALAFKLFVCLVHVVDFKTGHGHTGYPELIAMLTPAQPERGRPVAVPTRDEVKHMLRRFVDMGLIARDRAASEARGNIIFHMPPRSWETVSSELAARVSARGASARKPDEQRAKPKRAPTSRPGFRPHSHEPVSLTPTPENAKLSTSTETQSAHGAGEKLTPPRGLNVAPAGPTPPPEAQTGTGAGVGVGHQEGPPGGQTNAPAGHAPRAPVLYDDPSTWERDAQGRVMPPDVVAENLRTRKRHATKGAPKPQGWQSIGSVVLS